MIKLSVVLAVYNEEANLEECLKSVKDLTDEIIIVDGGSADKTIEVAQSFKAKIIKTNNPPIFHINKQKGLDAASHEWILQLDADERVTDRLKDEIQKVISMKVEELENYQQKIAKRKLFLEHQRLLEQRDGLIGTKTGEYVAFFIPRLNFFLGKYLRFGGVYPDGVIRLIKKGKGYFPCKSVHEQIVVKGRVGWLQSDLLHLADPTFKRYLIRNSRYIDLLADELRKDKVNKNLKQFLNFFLLKPILWFLLTQLKHKGIFDGVHGVIFSFFSALRFSRAYLRYLRK